MSPLTVYLVGVFAGTWPSDFPSQPWGSRLGAVAWEGWDNWPASLARSAESSCWASSLVAEVALARTVARTALQADG
jgi:hypothetical protein